MIFMRLVLPFGAVILGASVMSPSHAGAAEPSTDSSNVVCGLRIHMPNYPVIARAARFAGTAIAVITLGDDGQVVATEVTGVHPLLKAEVEKEMRASKFSPRCVGKQVRLIFDFLIIGEPVANPHSNYVFVPPNKFVVSTPPRTPMP